MEREISPPTEEEFRKARDDAEYDSEHSEDAFQVCRWFRGQLFLCERAERWLGSHRRLTDALAAESETKEI